MDTLHLHPSASSGSSAALEKRLQEFINSASKPLVVLVGPTASGKTALSIEMAAWIDGEIVNGDSRQLYRYLDIGTAKITPSEMQGVPHHLLDILDPREEATAFGYQQEALAAIDTIHARKKVPMIVGGSMLYISAVIDDLEFPTEKDERQSLQARKSLKPKENVLILGIERPRAELMKRINDRTAELCEKGWVAEVDSLMKRGYTAHDPGMKSHGYREIIAWLESGTPPIKELQETISSKTRAYAKRQMTWWKNDPRIEWITLN